MPTNFYMFFVSGLIPLFVGALYYSPLLFGNAWMKANGFKEKDLEGGNMMVIFGLSYVLGVMMSLAVAAFSIHQTQMGSLLMNDLANPETADAAKAALSAFMEQYGDLHRTFGHGAVHGFALTLLLVTPLLTINALFERRGAKYVFIHLGYWLITLMLMGGLLCATLQYDYM